MKRLGAFLFLATLLAFPAFAFAQDVVVEDAGDTSKSWITWILAGLGAVTAILVAVTNWFPGWGTYTSIALGVASSLTIALQDLAVSNPGASILTIVVTALAAVIGKARAKTREEAGKMAAFRAEGG